MKGIKGFQTGVNHPNWKGENAKYKAVHQWVYLHKHKPQGCEDCGDDKKLQAANISGEYKRDINDYKWLCIQCHSNMDNRSLKEKKVWERRKAEGYIHLRSEKTGRFISK